MQNLIVGNPIFISSDILSFNSNPSRLIVMMSTLNLKHLMTLENTEYKLLHSKIDDADYSRNRTMDITFSDHVLVGKSWFPVVRDISVSEKSKLDISLNFKDFNFNDALSYKFDIPKGYKEK